MAKNNDREITGASDRETLLFFLGLIGLLIILGGIIVFIYKHFINVFSV